MPNLATGMNVTGQDFPAAGYAADDTLQLNLVNTTYATGTPEVGVAFMAPTSGRVRVTVGGGCRDNGGNNDRVFLSPQIFRGPSADGAEVIVPSVVVRGYGSAGFSTEFAHASRTSQVNNLVPGETYYARVMHTTAAGSGTADIAAREITVIPVP